MFKVSKNSFVLACLTVLGLSILALSPVMAQEKGAIRAGVGYYDINDNKDATEFHVEYHAPYRFMTYARPFVGIMATSDSAVYGYVGVRGEFDLTEHVQIVPSFAPGLYADGDGKDLGHTIEFRSALEVNYKLQNQSRVGASVYHLSNAHLSDNNPGTEVFTVHYTYSLGR